MINRILKLEETESSIAISILVCVLLLFAYYVTQARYIMTAVGATLSTKWLFILLCNFGCFVFGAATLLLLFLQFIPLRNKRSRIIGKLFYFAFFSLVTVYVIFDTKLFITIGNHFFDDFVWQSISNREINREIHLSTSTAMFGIVLIVVLFCFPHALYYFIKKNRIILRYIKLTLLLPIFCLISCCCLFIFSHKAESIRVAFLWPNFNKQIYSTTGSSDAYIEMRNYAANPDALLSKSTKIVIIAIESFRADMIDIMPNLQRLQKNYGTFHSKRHYCGVNITQKSIFTLLYGNLGCRYELFCKDSIPSIPLQILKHNGYSLYGFSSSVLNGWGGADFITKQFDQYKEYSDSIPYCNDSTLVSELMHKYKENSDSSCLYFAFLNSSHHNYFYPPRFKKYHPVMPQNYNHFLGDDSLALSRDKILNRYKNSILYIDYLIGELASFFENDLKNNKLILVITGDHGEEFWDKGLLGHGASNLYNCRTQVPFFIHLPQKTQDTVNISSHLQVMPTILQQLDINEAVNKYCDAQSLMQKSNDFAIVTANDFESNGRICLVTRKQKYWMTVEKDSIKIDKCFTLQDEDTIMDFPHATDYLQAKILPLVKKY